MNSLSSRKINNVLIVFKFKVKKKGVVKGLAMICRPNHNFKIPCEFTKGEGCHTMILIKVGLKSKKITSPRGPQCDEAIENRLDPLSSCVG